MITMTQAHRPTRLRKTNAARMLLSETRLAAHDLIQPLFLKESITNTVNIPSMPGCYQLSLDALDAEIEEISKLNISAVLLFGIPAHKDETGSTSWAEDGIVQQAIRRIKQLNPELLVIADACFCEYTTHGHCGILINHDINHIKTCESLGKLAVSYAQAGADWVAPSGMIDGMVGAIRHALDQAGFINTAILSYAVKYCSALYGPFRQAAEGAPQFGDRKTYQMNPANVHEALHEAALDLKEGADLLMVKPAMLYLDVIARIKQKYPSTPLCAYQVSGEYAMLKFAGMQGLINPVDAMMESLIAIKRAGADLTITYYAKEAAEYLKQ